ncbi:MAG: C10 family peptidase [bacterium]
MRHSYTRFVCLLGLLVTLVFVTAPASAKLAAIGEMDRVAENWLTQQLATERTWAGSSSPAIAGVDDIRHDGQLLARCYRISLRGYIVVPYLQALAPVKAWSDRNDLDLSQQDGFAGMLREDLAERTQAFAISFGSLDADPTATQDPEFDRCNRAAWNRLSLPPAEFQASLTRVDKSARAGAGPLLTTTWHQSAPYNNDCPPGDGGRCLVGCVATATAQVMRYHAWPPAGRLTKTYYWPGDSSCGGGSAGRHLFADFNDTYDWANMPDNCTLGSPQAEQDAVAELCYEVGIAHWMHYGVCGSGAFPHDAAHLLPAFFGYRNTTARENRADYTAATWFDLIRTEIDAGRPMVYGITGHAIVCDGWSDTGGIDLYHINYGWNDSHTTWYAVDAIYGSGDPLVEMLVRGIEPGWEDAAWTVPAVPIAGQTVTVKYDPAGRDLEGAPAVNLHRGFNGWEDAANVPMSWNGGEGLWEGQFAVHDDVCTIDFVFNAGDTLWDNNAGSDWHMAVDGPCGGFVLDGLLDQSAELLASGPSFNLWGVLNGQSLYLAATPTDSTSGIDHFILAGCDTTVFQAAPWGKAGLVTPWSRFLAGEESNRWCGWFDPLENVITGDGLRCAHGRVLEGLIELETGWPGVPPVPGSLLVAVVGYQTSDGGALSAQTPIGNGNGDLEPGELVEMISTVVSVGHPDNPEDPEGPASPTPFILTLERNLPNPFNPLTTFRYVLPTPTPVRFSILDVRGQRIATLVDQQQIAGPHQIEWDGRGQSGAAMPSGVYLARLEAGSRVMVQKVTLVR